MLTLLGLGVCPLELCLTLCGKHIMTFHFSFVMKNLLSSVADPSMPFIVSSAGVPRVFRSEPLPVPSTYPVPRCGCGLPARIVSGWAQDSSSCPPLTPRAIAQGVATCTTHTTHIIDAHPVVIQQGRDTTVVHRGENMWGRLGRTAREDGASRGRARRRRTGEVDIAEGTLE
ncbi:hypothetical protein BDZ89DRAFT_569928 [Hymenopellis radicata]|nr:hypothetical protein BDZ89DRAFT_569928 [Hymenopellis radicata]